jgi:hypothetical protein
VSLLLLFPQVTICSVALMHASYVANLLMSSQPEHVVALNTLREVVADRVVLIALLSLTVTMAIAALHYGGANGVLVCVLLAPQQAFLLIPVIGSVVAVYGGHYAGELPQSLWLILINQFPRFVLFTLHFMSALLLSGLR